MKLCSENCPCKFSHDVFGVNGNWANRNRLIRIERYSEGNGTEEQKSFAPGPPGEAVPSNQGKSTLRE